MVFCCVHQVDLASIYEFGCALDVHQVDLASSYEFGGALGAYDILFFPRRKTIVIYSVQLILLG